MARQPRSRFVVPSPPHVDVRWQGTSCLCSCHFADRGHCDDLPCRSMRADEEKRAKVAA